MSQYLGSMLILLISSPAWADALAEAPMQSGSAADVVAVQVGADCRLSVEIRRDETPACWHWQCGTEPARELACDLTALHQVTDLSLAPDEDSLAVMSVGEGHPILEWVALAPLRDRGEYQVLCTQNPYPGTIWFQGWDDAAMQIGADVDLRIDGAEARIDVSSDRDFRFRWMSAGCQLEEIPAKPKGKNRS